MEIYLRAKFTTSQRKYPMITINDLFFQYFTDCVIPVRKSPETMEFFSPSIYPNIAMENHHLEWENSLFQWPFSSLLCQSLPVGNSRSPHPGPRTTHMQLMGARGLLQKISDDFWIKLVGKTMENPCFTMSYDLYIILSTKSA